ncbi:MAG: hypothetical protein JWP72_2952 [Massilia sp.]|nr:hypothetical protein [Massilia sp.]
MIYKDCDNKEPIVTILERMRALAGPDKRALIERQLRTIRAGIKGEREAAWLIDAYLKDATRTAVIHDLRLDLGGGQVAQIDHLLIHRTRRFYVLETKPFSHGVKITDDGEFLRWNEAGKTWEGMPSPLAQNERSVPVLRRALEQLGLGDCPIESWVLVAPNARIDRPRRLDTGRVIKADQFIEKMNKSLENAPALGALDGLLRTGLYDSTADIANKLVALHCPSTTDYMARFGVMHEAQPARAQAPAAGLATSAASAASAVALAAGCQDDGQASELADGPVEPAAVPGPAAAPACSACGSATLSIQHGRFGYYFSCAGCGGTTPVEVRCGNRGHQERIRKDGARFYRECGDCGTSSLYFTNAA